MTDKTYARIYANVYYDKAAHLYVWHTPDMTGDCENGIYANLEELCCIFVLWCAKYGHEVYFNSELVADFKKTTLRLPEFIVEQTENGVVYYKPKAAK